MAVKPLLRISSGLNGVEVILFGDPQVLRQIQATDIREAPEAYKQCPVAAGISDIQANGGGRRANLSWLKWLQRSEETSRSSESR